MRSQACATFPVSACDGRTELGQPGTCPDLRQSELWLGLRRSVLDRVVGCPGGDLHPQMHRGHVAQSSFQTTLLLLAWSGTPGKPNP